MEKPRHCLRNLAIKAKFLNKRFAISRHATKVRLMRQGDGVALRCVVASSDKSEKGSHMRPPAVWKLILMKENNKQLT